MRYLGLVFLYGLTKIPLKWLVMSKHMNVTQFKLQHYILTTLIHTKHPKTSQKGFHTFKQHCWCLIAITIHSSTFNSHSISFITNICIHHKMHVCLYKLVVHTRLTRFINKPHSFYIHSFLHICGHSWDSLPNSVSDLIRIYLFNMNSHIWDSLPSLVSNRGAQSPHSYTFLTFLTSCHMHT